MEYKTTPDRDATLGLIFRLNNLWAKVDTPAENGDYDAWNNILDRIFVNLDYKVDYVVTYVDEETKNKIKDITFDNEASKIFEFLSFKIAGCKRLFREAKNKKDLSIARGNYYHAVLTKDKWLRKYMMKLGLYLKEVEHSPGTALFGKFGMKKGRVFDTEK